MLSGPIEIIDGRLGRLLVSAWNVGAIMAVTEARLGDLRGANFVRGFLAELARRPSAEAPADYDAYERGKRVPRREIDGLSDGELETLAQAYLEGEEGHLREKDDGPAPAGETAVDRLCRLAVKDAKTFEETNKRLAERFAGLTVSSALKDSLARTAGIAKGLEGLIPRNLLALPRIGAIVGPSGIGQTVARAIPSAAVTPVVTMAPGAALEQTSRKTTIPKLELPPDPGHKTNKLLKGVSEGIDQLNGDIARMLKISEQQAALIQSLSETATLALGEAASSSADAKKSAELAKEATAFTKYSVVVAVVAIVLSGLVSAFAIWDTRRIAAENDLSTKELIDAVREGTRVGQAVQSEIAEQTKAFVGTHAALSSNISGNCQ